jgi:hypothetical protein
VLGGGLEDRLDLARHLLVARGTRTGLHRRHQQ